MAATLKPTGDSEIKIEVWMPASGWNGKLESVGNGAWAGSISYRDLATAVSAGYAAASTDTGHTETTAAFVVGHPEKLIDFAYRAIHEMTVAAKAIAAAYYGGRPARAYFNGCSTGGRQALAEAQRYPGRLRRHHRRRRRELPHAPARRAGLDHRDHAIRDDGYIPPAKYPLIHNAVLEACDALDGVKDRVLEDPRRCHFDPQTIACKGPDAADVPYSGASGSGAKNLCRARRGDFSGPGTRQRTRLGHALRAEAHGAGG